MSNTKTDDENLVHLLDQNADQKRSRFTFSQNWFSLIQHEWEERTLSLRDRKLRILEIGSFEGASTTWMLDNLMDHPDSTMTAIDTFGGGMEHREEAEEHGDPYGLATLEQRFLSNVSRCRHRAKLEVMKTDSDSGLLALRRENRRFDLIYIDASHVAVDVLHDAVVCWRMLDPTGLMVFDDFSWKGYLEDAYNPRVAIEGFVRCAEPEVECEETESQMWVRRVPNRVRATPNPDPAKYYWDRGIAKKPGSQTERL